MNKTNQKEIVEWAEKIVDLALEYKSAQEEILKAEQNWQECKNRLERVSNKIDCLRQDLANGGQPAPAHSVETQSDKQKQKKRASRFKRKFRLKRFRSKHDGSHEEEQFYRSSEYRKVAMAWEIGKPDVYWHNGSARKGVWLTDEERVFVCDESYQSKRSAKKITGVAR